MAYKELLSLGSVKRSFLFLQGVSTPFFSKLADYLQAEGHAVHRVNFNAGDWLYWFPRKAINFRGKAEDLPSFIEHIWLTQGITDQILFGDRRDVHRAAVDRAEQFGVRTHVFEEGYFRPHWVTLEREGVNGHSLLPRDPDWFREAYLRLPAARPEPQKFYATFRRRVAYDVMYHVAGAYNPILYPGYETHALHPAPQEYAGYLWRFAREPRWKKQEAVYLRELVRSKRPFFLLPLQLNSDAQIRYHSRFQCMSDVIDEVMYSFAKHSLPDQLLLIKNHPLDYGFVNYDEVVRRRARDYGLEGRVHFIQTGFLEYILKYAQGQVVVNSTSGIVSLQMGCPTLALSDPIYNLPGLTQQTPLDDFWQYPQVPDADLFKAFRETVIFTTQINGGFYSAEGIALAMKNAGEVLNADKSPLEQVL